MIDKKINITNKILLLIVIVLSSIIGYTIYKNKKSQTEEIAEIRKDMQFEIEKIRTELYLLDSIDRVSKEQINTVKTKLVYIKNIPIIHNEDSLVNSVNKTLGYE
jgi:hypothetical protein